MATSSRFHLVDAAYRDAPIGHILAAPVSALKGVSAADAAAFASIGVNTIGGLATNRLLQAAHSLLASAGTPGYDQGPPPDWEALFASAPASAYQVHPTRFRLDFGPVYYRGRLDRTARILIVGQDPATDEQLSHRTFVGQSSQRLQGLLQRLGVNRSYTMTNTFLYCIYGQFDSAMQVIGDGPAIRSYREQVLDKIASDNPLEAIITIGAAARHAISQWAGSAGRTINEIMHPAAPEAQVLADWNNKLKLLRSVISPDIGVPINDTPYGTAFTSADSVDIPRGDLPFGVPAWMGTGGGRSRRASAKELMWVAP